MKILHPSAKTLLVAKFLIGAVVCLLLASQDSNGLSLRDMLVGGGDLLPRREGLRGGDGYT